jgi:2-dehydropantoate 2-reductase
MRFIVFGAGAIGGVVGAQLVRNGHDVALVARGAHLDAIRSDGLRLETRVGSEVLQLPAAAAVAELSPGADDVVLLAVKGQDTAAALDDLVATAPNGVPVVCLQNGVDNERAALRRFPDVYGVCVMMPASHLEPGVVQASSWPTVGLLDIGRYPAGVDDTAVVVAAALSGSGFSSEAIPDVMRWKWAKLFMNLGNAVEALCGRAEGADEVARRARSEGRRCLEAAGIDAATREEDAARRGDLLQMGPVGGAERGGGSTWQSLARGAPAETDLLNGEVVLLGRLHGVPTPVNELLQRRVRTHVAAGGAPGTVDPAELLAELG